MKLSGFKAARRGAQLWVGIAQVLRAPVGPLAFLRSQPVRRSLLAGLVLALLGLLAGYRTALTHEMQHRQALLDDTARTITQNADTQRLFRLRTVQFLAATPPVQGLVRAIRAGGADARDPSSRAQWTQRLHQFFEAFLVASPAVHQVRLLSVAEGGREMARAQRGAQAIEIVPGPRLRRTALSPEAREALRQGPGSVVVSDLHLQREDGALQMPPRAVMRYATPVFDEQGEAFGVVDVLVDVEQAQQALAVRVPPGAQVLVTNAQGDYVVHPEITRRFGFEFGQRYRWQDDFARIEADGPGGTQRWRGPQGTVLVGLSESRANAGSDTGLLRVQVLMPERLAVQAAWARVMAWLPAAGMLAAIALLALYFGWVAAQRRREAQEQRLRLVALVEQTDDAIIGLDAGHRVTSWNRGAQRLLGHTPEEALGRAIADLVLPPGSGDDPLAATMREVGQGRSPHLQDWLCTRDGRMVEVSATLSPLIDADGRVSGAAAIVRDITQERAAQRRINELNARLEEEVRERTASLSLERERLDNILRGTNAGTWEWNVQSGERRYNLRYAEMLGLTPAALRALGSDAWTLLVHPQDREIAHAELQRHFRRETEQYECELRMRHRDGHWIWVLDRGRVSAWTEDGQPQVMHGTHRDITAAKLAQQRLAASQALLDRTGRVAGVGGWQFDLQSWAVEWTPTMYALHEVPEDFALTPTRPFDFYVGDAREQVAMALRQARKQGLSFDFEVPFRTARGRELRVRLVGEPVLDEAGRVVRIVGALQDVTDVHAMQAELLRINELQHSILENMPCAISAVDADLRLVAWNSEFVRLLDLGALFERGVPDFEEMIRFNATRGEYGDGPVEPKVQAMVERARHPVPHRFERTRPDGTPIEVRGIPMPGGGFVTTYMDMSERKRAEQVIARNASLLRGAIDTVDEAFVIFDPQDRLLLCNEKYRRLYGEVADLLVPGTRFETILRASAERGLDAEMQGDLNAWIDHRMAQHRDGNAAYIQRVAGGRVVRVIERRMPDGHTVGFRVDVTDLMRATEAAEAAARAKGEFLANMSHEIRTPLHAVIGLSHLLADTPLSARQQQLLARSQMASQSLLGIVNDVLDMAKIEAGALTLEVAPFSPAQLLGELDAVFRQQAEAKGLALRVTADAALPAQLQGDALRLRQVLTNLLGNALKFTAKGEVDVRLWPLDGEQPPGVVRLRGEVRDTGEGIEPEVRARLFSPFSQADASTSRRHGGTGLGLSIVRRLVELMNGRIGVQSTPGEGSTFWFEVELQCDANPAAEAEAGGGLEVLVVDDVPAERQSLVDMARAFGWRTTAFESGEALVAWMERRASAGQPLPDAMLVDWQLQDAQGAGMDGLQALAVLAERLGLSRLPAALMVSASEREQVARRDEMRLADDILTKPVNASVLFNAVNQGVVSRQGHSRRVLSGAATVPLAEDTRLDGVRVLVVDDSEINQEIAQHMLGRAGAEVFLAANGREALVVLQEAGAGIDAVLMDVQMPEMDGLQATRALRADAALAHLPVIALTAGALAEERRRALDAGMDDFLTKPLDPSRLVSTLQTVLARRGVDWRRASATEAACNARPAAALAADWPDIDGLDAASAARRLGGDVGLLRRSLRRLIDEFGGLADLPLPEPLDDSARADLARRVHKLRGAAGLIDATAVHRGASAVENGLRDGQAAASLAPAWLALQGGLRRLRRASAAWLASEPREDVAGGASVAPLPTAQLQHLHQLLSRHDLDALTLVETHTAALRTRLGEPAWQRMSECIETLDFGAAADLVQQAMARDTGPGGDQ